MSIVLFIAPHPDDETLGCGGTILKHLANGDEIHWLIVTGMKVEFGFSQERVDQRQYEIEKVAHLYGFKSTTQLGFQPAGLDETPTSALTQKVSEVVTRIRPDTIYLPYRGDVHSDHARVFDATVSCSKSFRYPWVKQLLCYETLSETDFSLNPDLRGFTPNVFVNITDFLETKLDIAAIYASEMAAFPFPRSRIAMTAQAQVRGATSGYGAAEAFILLRDRRD